MKQKRLESLVESLVNVAVGYVVAVASQVLLFPLFGIDIPFASNLMIAIWFTVISIARSYTIRRWFNQDAHNFAVRTVKKLRGRY
jgi:hypothetical protein